jgi:hypothetical protein
MVTGGVAVYMLYGYRWCGSVYAVWLQVVWQCYLMLVKQRDLVALHRPPENRDKLKEHDLRVSEAAGALFGDKASLMTARYRLCE